LFQVQSLNCTSLKSYQKAAFSYVSCITLTQFQNFDFTHSYAGFQIDSIALLDKSDAQDIISHANGAHQTIHIPQINQVRAHFLPKNIAQIIPNINHNAQPH